MKVTIVMKDMTVVPEVCEETFLGKNFYVVSYDEHRDKTYPVDNIFSIEEDTTPEALDFSKYFGGGFGEADYSN